MFHDMISIVVLILDQIFDGGDSAEFL